MNSTENDKYKWQSSGHRYLWRIEFANNKLATQIINATHKLAELETKRFALNLGRNLVGLFPQELKDYRERILKAISEVEKDLRQLAQGKTIDEP